MPEGFPPGMFLYILVIMNAFDIIESEIGKHAKTVIIGHIQPDGDCMGSSFGLFHLIKDNWGITPVVVNQDIRRFHFLGSWTLPGNTDYSDAFVIQVDNSTRLRSADPSFMNAPSILKIDHHIVTDSYGNWNIEKQLSSCCQIIAEEAFSKGLKVSAEAAQALYMGMVTDTGRFAYDGVDASTLEVASLLLKTGFDMPSLIERIEVRSIESVRFMAQCYNDLRISEGGVPWIYVKQETIDRYHLSPDMVSQALSVMRNIEGHPVYVLFADLEGKVRVELRSERIPVVSVAMKFGGGGHNYACGARLAGAHMIPDVIRELESVLKES